MKENQPTFPSEMERANIGRDFSIYMWRMDAASETKVESLFSRFRELHDGMRIVDMGSGTGLVAEKIAEKCRRLGFTVEVLAVDISHEFYDASSDQPLIQLVFGDASTPIFPDDSIDIFYSSTSGHEIESFGGSGKMIAMVTYAFAALRAEGQIIIRDFVMPDIQGPIIMELPHEDGLPANLETPTENVDYNKLSTFAKFLRFHHEFAGGNAFTFSQLEIEGKQLIQLDAEWAYEFYMRKEYTGNWRNEIKEKYSYWTLQDATEVLTRAGFTDVQVEPDSSEYMLNNWLRGKIGLYQLSARGTLNPIDFPPTHMLVSGRKSVAEDALTEPDFALPSVDFTRLIDSIKIDEVGGTITFSPWKLDQNSTLTGDTHVVEISSTPPMVGNKFSLYQLKWEPGKVIKVPNHSYFDALKYPQRINQFKALIQTIERQSVLDMNQTPHLAVVDFDSEGPPYRFLIQEALPANALCAADLVLSDTLTEEDVKQMCEIINQYEKNKTNQLDSNPFAWYRVPQSDGTTRFTYVSGKVYSYHEDWAFTKIGLLQWTDKKYLENASYYSAAIPKNHDQRELAHNWYSNPDSYSTWKKYLDPSIWPIKTN